jgi:hypothetical protein
MGRRVEGGVKMTDSNEFRIDVGRAGEGQTFVRVVHIPSGKQRTKLGLESASTKDIAAQIIEELSKEISVPSTE